MPFPSFPVEIWFQIMDRTCQDDGTTGLALSATSRELRALSELHRFQSVQINGWRQLLAFEKLLSQAPKAQQGVLNLFVYLPSAFDAGYPGVPKWAPDEDSEEDASYVPSDSEDESDEDEGEGGEEEEERIGGKAEGPIHEGVLSSKDLGNDEGLGEVDGDTDATPDIWDEELELEQSPLSEEERLSLVRETTENLLGDRTSLVPELTKFEHCEQDARQTYAVEHHMFVTLTRLLKTCSPSLQIFTLSWDPFFTFKIGQVIPMLPKLKSLSIWVCGQPNPELESLVSWDHRPPHHPADKIVLFPSLERLEINNPFCAFWLEYLPLQNLKLKYATVPCTSVPRIFDARPIRVRVFCNCRTCMPVPPSPNVFRAQFVDFRQNWIDQVLQCTMFSGYEPRPITSSPTFQQLIKEQFDEMLMKLVGSGRLLLVENPKPLEDAAALSEKARAVEETPPPPVPVMVVVWLEDGAGYHDLLLITGEDGCIRLADQRQQLNHRGVDLDVTLEMYDPLGENWSPMSWSQALGPFDGAGGTVLLRRTGVTKLSHFGTFLPLVRSLKKGKRRA